jgi:hypothetical protein
MHLNITQWRVRVTIVAMEMQQYVPWYFDGLNVTVNNIKVFNFAMERQQRVPLALSSS